MDIFNKIGNVASETYKYTAEKTSKIAKEAKIRMKINEYKSKISDLYEQIGKIIYQKHIREEDINIKEDIEEYCAQIDSISKAIEDNRMELLNLNDKKQCEKCFAQINIDDKYCPNCGTKQTKNDVEVKNVEVIDEEDNSNQEHDIQENQDDDE